MELSAHENGAADGDPQPSDGPAQNVRAIQDNATLVKGIT
jgi:hypothetical protein